MTVWKRKEIIGDCTLYLGDCLEVMPTLAVVDHMIFDPPYEDSLHEIKSRASKRIRVDGRLDIRDLNFVGIDAIRDKFADLSSQQCTGWFIAFCTIEGVARWADAINPSSIKYKRGCIWIKPDSTPQLNGQGPAQGAECFVVGWCGSGYSKWNGGGKRGIYTHLTSPSDRQGQHPTEKPWRLFVELLHDFTNREQTILDPFMGSGTTLVACAKTGRKGIGIELDPYYFEIACKRVRDAYAQPDLFIEQPKADQPKQEAMDL